MRKQVELSEVLNETLEKLDGDGILLVAGNPPNPMTIGWSTISTIHFECRTVHKQFLDPSTLDPAIAKRYYPKKDFLMVCYGEILGIYRKL
jgi:hypothetical protein